MTYFVEVSTLFDANWSGIANVTASIIRELLSRNLDVQFFAYDVLIKLSYIKNAVENNDGAGLTIMFEHGFAIQAHLDTRYRSSKTEIAIFPNFKRARESFAMEVLIVNDISFALMPEFHRSDFVRDYLVRLHRDANGVDLVCCISEATRQDVVRYYGVPAANTLVSHLGVSPLPNVSEDEEASILVDFGLSIEYVLVLGTIEPRKNVGLVLDYISMSPHICNNFMIVFVGRNGWGPTFNELKAEAGITSERVVHFGYVPERVRAVLVRRAAALLFPSFFEGFGLPVIEAMAAGIPVIASRSSSIVELGVSSEYMFDPCSRQEFAEVLERFQGLSKAERSSIGLINKAWAKPYTWSAFVDRILERVSTCTKVCAGVAENLPQ